MVRITWKVISSYLYYFPAEPTDSNKETKPIYSFLFCGCWRLAIRIDSLEEGWAKYDPACQRILFIPWWVPWPHLGCGARNRSHCPQACSGRAGEAQWLDLLSGGSCGSSSFWLLQVPNLALLPPSGAGPMWAECMARLIGWGCGQVGSSVQEWSGGAEPGPGPGPGQLCPAPAPWLWSQPWPCLPVLLQDTAPCLPAAPSQLSGPVWSTAT